MLEEAFKLCMPYIGKDDLKNLFFVSKKIKDDARQEMRHRLRKLAQLAYVCIEENYFSLVIAGSMALWLRQGSPTTWFPNDVDLFFYGGPNCVTDWEERKCTIHFNADGTIHTIPFIFHKRPLVRTVETTLGSVQFILTSLFETPEDILKTFDLTCCRIATRAKDKFITLQPYFDPNVFKWSCPSNRTVIKFGNGDKKDLIALKNFQVIRTKQRAKKYEARGLINVGFEEGSIDLLTFSCMYRRPSSMVYQNILVPSRVNDERILRYCSCSEHLEDWCTFCKESMEARRLYAHDFKKNPKEHFM